jgi:Uma2 family endonuclease
MDGPFAGLGCECKRAKFEYCQKCGNSCVMNALLPLTELKPHKLTVDDYLTLHLQGRFDMCGKIELLDGEIYEMSPQSRPHVIAKNELGWRLRECLESTHSPFAALIEPTISVKPNSAPEPDVVVYDPAQLSDSHRPDYFASDTVKLAIEVSLTTLVTDLRYKRQLYAQAQIPEYWVLDIEAQCVHQFWSPAGETYLESRIINIGETLNSVTIPGLSVETAGLI